MCSQYLQCLGAIVKTLIFAYLNLMRICPPPGIMTLETEGIFYDIDCIQFGLYFLFVDMNSTLIDTATPAGSATLKEGSQTEVA